MTDATGQDPERELGPDCSACSRPLRPGARFCAACGRAVDPRAAAVASSSAEPAEPAIATTAIRLPGAAPAPGEAGVLTPLPASDLAERDDGRGPGAGIDGSGTLRCPGCGALNDAQRVLCGACGLDLLTGDPELSVTAAPAAPRASGSGVPVADDGPAHVLPWWVAVLAGLVALAGVAAAIVALGLDPAASEDELPTAHFVAERYPGEPSPLVLTDVATLTFQGPVGGRTFTPEHLVDGDATTVWHGDDDSLPAGAVEKLDLFLDQPAWIAAVVIDNGDHFDAEAYAATSRVQRAMTIVDGDVRVPVTLLDQGLAPQIVEFDEPLLSTTMRIEILETVAGTELEEVAISRIELLGFAAEGDDVSLAEERAGLAPAAGAVTLPA